MKNKLLKFYGEKYDLKKFEDNVSTLDIAFLIYDCDNNYYFNKDDLLGEKKPNQILKIIHDYNKKYKLKITNFYPVCFCDKTLVIAFKTDNINSNLNKYKSNQALCKYKFLIEYHQNNFETMFVSTTIKNEIKASQKNKKRYFIHEKIIKKYIFTSKKRKKDEFKSLLNNLIPNKSSIIDVSCGDNSDIFSLALKKKYKVIVGNDICINYLNTQENYEVIYTNDDIEQNLIKEGSYDVSFCKNTLHHMSNLSNINNMLQFLNRISNEIIIVEISNPLEQGGLPKFLNKYLYTWFLKDLGRFFLNNAQFKNIIEKNFTNHKIDYYEFSNILGTYMIAKIVKEKK